MCLNGRVISGIVLVLLLSTTSSAQAGTQVTNLRVKGSTATAVFEWVDPDDPCVTTAVFVAGADTITRILPGKGTVSNGLTLQVTQTDTCTNTTLFLIIDEVTESQTFSVAANNSSATLSASIIANDGVSKQDFPFQIDLTWTATSKPVFTQAKEVFTDPELGIKFQSQTRSTVADATATGTVFGAGQNMTPNPSVSASIHTGNDGTLIIQRSQ